MSFNVKRRLVMLAGFVGLIIVAGCAKPELRCTAPGDNPEHHYLIGMNSLAESEWSVAAAKFKRALFCDERFSPSYAGLAMVYAERASVGGVPKSTLAAGAYRMLGKAKKYSRTPEDAFDLRVAHIRVYTALKPGRWLKKAEGEYKSAMKLKVRDARLPYYAGPEAASYFMGVAYLEGKRFREARQRFNDVLAMGPEGKWNGPADMGWKKADRIVRAIGGATLGNLGAELALKRTVSREDLAALLIDELKIERLFAGRIPVKGGGKETGGSPVDIQGSPFREEILTVAGLGIRGLTPVYESASGAYHFKPSRDVSRKEFAFIIEDMLVKLTGDEKITTAFVGHRKSPFPDVPTTAPWYNAIMNATTRNIMETEISGEFRPGEPLSGPAAVLAVRVLRQQLNIH